MLKYQHLAGRSSEMQIFQHAPGQASPRRESCRGLARRRLAARLLEITPRGPPAGVDARDAAQAADEEGGHDAKLLPEGPADGAANVDADEDEEFHIEERSMNEAGKAAGAVISGF